MKIFRLLLMSLLLLIAQPCVYTSAAGSQYHVTPTALSSGNGSQANPWQLTTALHSSTVKPGDTVTVHGGTYLNPTNGTWASAWTSTLQGSSAAPILVRVPKGDVVVLDGEDTQGDNILTIESNYVWYWGLEVRSSDGRRVDNVDWLSSGGSYTSPVVHVGQCVTISQDINTVGNKFIACTFDNGLGGIASTAGLGAGQSGTTAEFEFYDCLFINNGWYNTLSGIRGPHGHNIYVHNNTGRRCAFINCININPTENPVQAWGGLVGTSENDFVFDGMTVIQYGPAHDGRILVGDSYFSNPTIINGSFYSDNASNVQLGYDNGSSYPNVCTGGNISNNYSAGGGWNIVCSFNGTTFNNNTIYYQSLQGSFPNGSGNTLTTTKPTGNIVTTIRKSPYESGRASVTVFNWMNASSVSVDLSSVFNVGDTYTIVDAQNPHVVLLTGTYNGPVSIPLVGTAGAVEQLIGVDGGVGNVITYQPRVHTPSEFGCFIITGKTNGSTTITPPTVVTSAASLIATTTVQLNGTVNPNGASTAYHFDYGTTTGYGTSTTSVSAGAGSVAVNAVANLTGLTQGTLYHFRLVASNGGGTTNGIDATFTTSINYLTLYDNVSIAPSGVFGVRKGSTDTTVVMTFGVTITKVATGTSGQDTVMVTLTPLPVVVPKAATSTTINVPVSVRFLKH